MTIPQRLREIAKSIVECHERRRQISPYDIVRAIKDMANELEAPAADAPKVVMLWRETLPDGRYNHSAKNEPLIRQRDHLATVAALKARINALEEQQNAIEHALYGLVNRCNADAFLATDDAVIHAEATLERLYVARRLASSSPQPSASKEARQVPASADDEYAVVWPDGFRFVAGTLKSAEDYMSGAVPSCAKRGVEPPVIVRYVPAETVPYEPGKVTS